MTGFAEHVEEYLRLRRSLGYKLDEAARLLPPFAAHLDDAGAAFVTIELGLAWALDREVPEGSTTPCRMPLRACVINAAISASV